MSNNDVLKLIPHDDVGLTSPLIFASCRDCPSYLALAETIRDLCWSRGKNRPDVSLCMT